MRKLILCLTMLIASSFMVTSCAPPAANSGNTANAANKPATNSATAPAPVADAAAIEAEVKKLANDGVASLIKGDIAAVEKLWADNYVFVAQDGSVSTKAQRIESMKSGQSKIDSLSYDEMTVRSNPEGTGAILIGRATVKGTNLGKPVDGQMRFTQVWSKTKDGWRAVSGQVTPITAAAAPAKADDANKAANSANTAKSSAPAPANK